MDPTVEGKRRATIMKRIHMARKRGERIQVTFDKKGQPEGKHGDELMSWIGVLAREHVPIWIQDWRSRDLDGLKEIIWKETVTSFTVEESFRNTCLKSCGQAARNFRYDLTSSQFQQLSDRGSEIRTNNEYSSRGGRDGYRKLDQEMFKKNGKWERRDGLWLEQQTGPDGELKNPACKNASELIVEYNTQESQGTFESVGTNDVLSQALSRPEHKGRVRGQSKFVKPSQYFNLSRSSNKDNEVQSMRREIEELKALVRGLCANRDVEPSVDPKNVPTVDQHNSFKASCSAQEKQDGVAEPPTMPVDSQECKLYIFDEVQGGQLLVAFGRVWWESLPTDTVHGIPLGEGNVRVSINVPKLKKSLLPIPTYDATTVEDAVNGFVAWPKSLVKLDMSMNKASRGPSHVPDPAAGNKKRQKKAGNKTIDSRTEVQQGAQEQKLVFDFNNMNRAMKPLAYYAHSSMRQGNQIEVPIPYTIMGFDMPVFLSFEDIYEFINLQGSNQAGRNKRKGNFSGQNQQGNSPQKKNNRGNENTNVSYPACATCGKKHPRVCRMGTNACYLCGKEGHYARNCPQNNQNQNQSPQYPNRNASSQLHAVQAKLEGPSIAQGRLEAPEPQARIYAYTDGNAEAGTSNVVTR
ncbi:hypothetical protein TIFTF001_033542 [Ficus carica]|uniref:CCHC-type domain-containing protein n=1 Tax=Ficus carica TaxID=3494 RepID=A0AA88DYE2_FICCA|nr:hypothetical protein TIFTF001_033542 [Ficus carica]